MFLGETTPVPTPTRPQPALRHRDRVSSVAAARCIKAEGDGPSRRVSGRIHRVVRLTAPARILGQAIIITEKKSTVSMSMVRNTLANVSSG